MKRSGLQKPKPNKIGFGSQSSNGNIKKRTEIIPLKRFAQNFQQKTKLDWLLEIFEPEFNYIDTTESEARLVVNTKKLED